MSQSCRRSLRSGKRDPIVLLPRIVYWPETATTVSLHDAPNAIYSLATGDPMTIQSRRWLLRALAAGGATYTVPGLFAERLNTTVSLGEGPFYPDRMPLDTDNDL